jgi:broad specificity phosphatase PhoE
LKKIIYLIRHGETDYNRRGVVQGSGIDADLNETGNAQAARFFEAHRQQPFQKIYTSALVRTQQSVKQFIALGIPHEAHAGLNEISWGVREGKIPSNNDSDYYQWLTQSWQNGQVDLAAEGGESPQDVQARQQLVIDLILSRTNEELILVAMHGRAMRILLASIMGQPLSQMDSYEHTNLGLYVIEYNYSTATFTILQTNDTTHLSGL